MADEKYIMGIDPYDSGKNEVEVIIYSREHGNLINISGPSYLNKWGMKEFDAAIKRIAAASNIKTIDEE